MRLLTTPHSSEIGEGLKIKKVTQRYTPDSWCYICRLLVILSERLVIFIAHLMFIGTVTYLVV